MKKIIPGRQRGKNDTLSVPTPTPVLSSMALASSSAEVDLEERRSVLRTQRSHTHSRKMLLITSVSKLKIQASNTQHHSVGFAYNSNYIYVIMV